GGGAGGGETCAGAGAGGGDGGATSRSSSSRSLRRRDSKRPETETEAQDVERQLRGASMRMRCPPTENEIDSPAQADVVNTISAARLQSRFIGASHLRDKKLGYERSIECDLSHPSSTPSWPGIAVRRTASLPLAYVPAIHAFPAERLEDVDARHKAGHDELGCRSSRDSRHRTRASAGVGWRHVHTPPGESHEEVLPRRRAAAGDHFRPCRRQFDLVPDRG